MPRSRRKVGEERGMGRQPEGPPPPPVVQRLRVRYAKRGPLRFTSHRDFARAFERALRRAGVPMAYSAGFSPHPKISYAGAAPTGVASEAEYLEIGLARVCEPEDVRAGLDAALPPGLDVVDVVEAEPPGLAERLEASRWRIVLPGVPPVVAQAAVTALLAAESVPVERPTKDGTRTVDARAVVLALGVSVDDEPGETGHCAILDVVMRHATPAVRPDDVLTALRHVSDLSTPVTPMVTRLAQGRLDEASPTGPGGHPRLIDPLRRDAATTPPPH
jgi:radical SAM-linked protein